MKNTQYFKPSYKPKVSLLTPSVTGQPQTTSSASIFGMPNRSTNTSLLSDLPPYKPMEPFGGYEGFSPNWQKIQSSTAQQSALTGQVANPQEMYGLLEGHFDVAGKAAMESRRLWEERRTAHEQYGLQRKGLELQEKQIKQQEGAKVICTELYEQGYLSLNILNLDGKYRELYIDNGTYLGYRMWANPIVKWMKKSKVFTRVVSWFALPWAFEAAHKVNNNVQGHWLGSILLKVGIPFCKRLWIRDCIKKMKEVQHG